MFTLDIFDHYDIPEDNLIWFTLAAYNAGSGHVTDAIRLAKQKGWDGTKWFDNVERAMLLLSVFGNAYVWAESEPAQVIPQSIAVPWRRVADTLGRPPR